MKVSSNSALTYVNNHALNLLLLWNMFHGKHGFTMARRVRAEKMIVVGLHTGFEA